MGSPRHVLDGVSATDVDSVSHACVVASARTYLHVSFARVVPRCPLCFQV